MKLPSWAPNLGEFVMHFSTTKSRGLCLQPGPRAQAVLWPRCQITGEQSSPDSRNGKERVRRSTAQA